jgi:hypothetical protein
VAGANYFGNAPYETFIDGLRQMKESPEIMDFMESILPRHDYVPPVVEFSELDINPQSYDTDQLNSAELIRQSEFLNPLKDMRVQFLYEATVLLGLSACAAASDDLFLDGSDLFQQIVSTPFQGISGMVKLDPETGSRLPNSTAYAMQNFVEQEAPDGNASNIVFQAVLSDVYYDGYWDEIQPFVFNDGSTTFVPAKLWMDTAEVLHYSTGVRATALTLCGISILLSLCCMGWTFVNRNTRIIRASQPFFLYIICVGTIILCKYDQKRLPGEML